MKRFILLLLVAALSAQTIPSYVFRFTNSLQVFAYSSQHQLGNQNLQVYCMDDADPANPIQLEIFYPHSFANERGDVTITFTRPETGYCSLSAHEQTAPNEMKVRPVKVLNLKVAAGIPWADLDARSWNDLNNVSWSDLQPF